MTIGESLALVSLILIIATAIAYNLQKGMPTINSFTEDLDQDLEDKPKIKPTKPRVNKVHQEEKVFDETAAINLDDHKDEVVLEPAKPKKKKKYYPRKPKTN